MPYKVRARIRPKKIVDRTCLVRARLVPKAEPNDDGEWQEVELRYMPRTWDEAEQMITPLIPETHFLVRYERTELCD